MFVKVYKPLTMVEVFVTDISDKKKADLITAIIKTRLNYSRVDIDVDDCDRVLRVEGEGICTEDVAAIVKCEGHACTIME